MGNAAQHNVYTPIRLGMYTTTEYPLCSSHDDSFLSERQNAPQVLSRTRGAFCAFSARMCLSGL